MSNMPDSMRRELRLQAFHYVGFKDGHRESFTFYARRQTIADGYARAWSKLHHWRMTRPKPKAR